MCLKNLESFFRTPCIKFSFAVPVLPRTSANRTLCNSILALRSSFGSSLGHLNHESAIKIRNYSIFSDNSISFVVFVRRLYDKRSLFWIMPDSDSGGGKSCAWRLIPLSWRRWCLNTNEIVREERASTQDRRDAAGRNTTGFAARTIRPVIHETTDEDFQHRKQNAVEIIFRVYGSITARRLCLANAWAIPVV